VPFNQLTACTVMNFIHVWQITDYDWASGEYSSWTESRWKNLAMRIFLTIEFWAKFAALDDAPNFNYFSRVARPSFHSFGKTTNPIFIH
jgi:hypothetical protein